MPNINDHPISLSSNYVGSDSSPLVWAEAYSSLGSYRLVNNQSVLMDIPVSNDSKTRRLSSDSLIRETSFDESFFDYPIFDEDMGRDHVVNYKLASIQLLLL